MRYDCVECAARYGARFDERGRARHLDALLVEARAADERRGLGGLQLLGLGVGSLEGVRDVVRHVIASNANHASRGEVSVGVRGVSGRATAYVEDKNAVAALMCLEDSLCGARGGEKGVAYLELGALRSGTRVVDAVAVCVNLQRVEL